MRHNLWLWGIRLVHCSQQWAADLQHNKSQPQIVQNAFIKSFQLSNSTALVGTERAEKLSKTNRSNVDIQTLEMREKEASAVDNSLAIFPNIKLGLYFIFFNTILCLKNLFEFKCVTLLQLNQTGWVYITFWQKLVWGNFQHIISLAGLKRQGTVAVWPCMTIEAASLGPCCWTPQVTAQLPK